MKGRIRTSERRPILVSAAAGEIRHGTSLLLSSYARLALCLIQVICIRGSAFICKSSAPSTCLGVYFGYEE